MQFHAVPPPTARRWYGHGWNRPVSWKLMLSITPRLPRFLLVPLHHATTLLCCACMSRERAAARRNLHRVTGRTGMANLWLTYRLFYNFSRFMVAYGAMRDQSVDQLHQRLIGAAPAERVVRDLLREGRGIVLATMHMGQWDLGLKLLARFQVPVHVVMRSDDPREVTRYADESRAWADLRVHQIGASPLLAVELKAALERGEVVALQIDRPVGGNVRAMQFFGAETELPTGPVQLAIAAGAPVLPVFVLLDRGRNYRVVTHEPLRFEQPPGERIACELQDAMQRLVQVMESVVSRHPDQWFNFYDVWPPGPGADARG